jgi:competence protein ComEC
VHEAPFSLSRRFFAGGILLFGRSAGHWRLSPGALFIAALILLLLGYVSLKRKWILTAAAMGAAAWLCLGYSASCLERASTPTNLAGALIESGKLDSSAALRWRGRLRGDPLELPWGTRYEINLEEVETSSGTLSVAGGMRLTSYRDDDANGGAIATAAAQPRAGDVIEVLVHALPIRDFGDPGSFDERGALARQNIQLQGTLRNRQLLTVISQTHLTISDRLARARGQLLSTLNRLYASRPEEGALARAILLGDRSFVERDVVAEFQKAGVYHVLVLAGLHVSALMAFFIWAGSRFRYALPLRTVLMLAGLAAYGGFVEDRPPIVRAVLMAALYLLARLLHRKMDLLNIVALAALAILAFRPSEIGDPGFLLSFAAVGVIGALAVPWIENSSELYRKGLADLMDFTRDILHPAKVIQFRIEMRAAAAWLSARLPKRIEKAGPELVRAPLRVSLFVWELVVVSAILQLGMLPVQAYYFNRVTLAGPLTNVPAVFLTGLAVPLGFVTLAASFVSGSLAAVPAGLLGFILAGLNAIVHRFAQWHGTSYRIPGPSHLVLSIFALLTIILSAVSRTRRRRRWQIAVLVPLLATAAIVAIYPFPPDLPAQKLELTVLDVGQGDSLFVSFPDGRTMLVDGGGELGSFHAGGMRSGPDLGEDVVSPYLWSRGLKRIDVIALTHAHEDHLGGLPAVLENFQVRELWLGRDIEIAAYRNLLDVARRRGTHVRHMKQGDSFNRANVAGTVLWPDDARESRSAKNDDSLVMRLTDGSQSMLLAGDIERPAERKILAEDQPVRVNFLKIAHHGSKTSTSDAFLEAVHPVFAAISVGRDNSFGHPSPETIERLEAAGVQVYRTDRDGAITASTDGTSLTVSTYTHSGR